MPKGTLKDQLSKANHKVEILTRDLDHERNQKYQSTKEAGQFRTELEQVKDRLGQSEVQLAGCGTAALGLIREPAKQGDYGWSRSYQDVLDLRRKYEACEDQADFAAGEASRIKQHCKRCFDEVESNWGIIRNQESCISDLRNGLKSYRKANTLIWWGLGFLSAGGLLLIRRR